MATEADTQIVMKLPPEMVRAQVQAAVVMALSKDPEALVRAVVEAAMTEPDRNNYNKTIWDVRINTLIREVAEGAAKEWIAEQAPKIRAAIRKRFDAGKSTIIAKLCDDVSKMMIENLHVQVTMREPR